MICVLKSGREKRFESQYSFKERHRSDDETCRSHKKIKIIPPRHSKHWARTTLCQHENETKLMCVVYVVCYALCVWCTLRCITWWRRCVVLCVVCLWHLRQRMTHPCRLWYTQIHNSQTTTYNLTFFLLPSLQFTSKSRRLPSQVTYTSSHWKAFTCTRTWLVHFMPQCLVTETSWSPWSRLFLSGQPLIRRPSSLLLRTGKEKHRPYSKTNDLGPLMSVPNGANWNLLTQTKDATMFSMSCQSDEHVWNDLCTKLMKTTFVIRTEHQQCHCGMMGSMSVSHAPDFCNAPRNVRPMGRQRAPVSQKAQKQQWKEIQRPLRMEQLRQCNPCLEDYDMAFSQILSLEKGSRPMHCAEQSNSSTHDQVQYLFCILMRRLLEMLTTVPELSNVRTFWRRNHNKIRGLALLDQNICNIKSTWLLVTFQLPCRDPTCRCSFENSVSNNRPGHNSQDWSVYRITRNHHRNFPVGITRNVGCKRVVELNCKNVLCVLPTVSSLPSGLLALMQTSQQERKRQCVASWDWRSSFVESQGFGGTLTFTC